MAEVSRVMEFHGAGRPLELRRYPLPHLADGEVLVRITCCTLCGSDIHTYEGRRSTPCPTVLGHEILGRVAELPAGSVVRDHEGTPLEIGDRITWSVAASCGSCFFCQDELPQKCERLFKYGHEKMSDRHPLSGGLADYCHLAAGTAICRVPCELSDAVACPTNCATATVAAAMEVGIELLRIGGRYLWVGAVFPARPLAVSAETIVRKILSIQRVHNYAPRDVRRALEFLQHYHRQFPFEELVAQTFALEDAGAAFLHASRSGVLRVAVRA